MDDMLSSREIIRHLKYYYDDYKRQINADENIDIIVPLGDGTRLSLNLLQPIAPNFIRVDGLDEGGEEVVAFVSQGHLQFIFRIVKKDPQSPTKEIGFMTTEKPQG